MRPWMVPCSTSSDTPSTARTPPKWRWTLSSRRSTGSSSWPPGGPDDGEAAPAHDPLRPEHDDGDQENAAHDVDVDTGRLEDPGQESDEQGADYGSEDEAAAAEHGEGQDLDRASDAVLGVSGVDEEVQVRFESPRETGHDGAEDEREHLVPGDVDALAERRDLVLPDRGPRVTDPALGEPPRDEDHRDEGDEDGVDASERVGT